MLRGTGMSILLSWICLNSYAQLPHPNDTLENGKKVSFNQFLGRFSVFNEFAGAGLVFSLNASYSIIKRDIHLLDFTVGANRVPYFAARPNYTYLDTYRIPIGLSLYVGRRKSRVNTRIGYSPIIQPGWYEDDDNPYPNCAGECPKPLQHSFYLGLGYVFQHQRGFFFGIHAYGSMTMPLKETVQRFGNAPYFLPSGGLTLGYRLPSIQQHREWTERSFNRRVLRLEEPERRKKNDDIELDDVFFEDYPLEIDSVEMFAIEKRLARMRKRHLRYQLQEQRLNGRSHVFLEAFGAAGFWSVNYSYTHPIGKSKIFAMDYRGGYGTDSEDMTLPIAIGVKAIENYRGAGVFLGVEPRYNWVKGKANLLYFLEHNVEFHFAYGLTGGVTFYLYYDPNRFVFQSQFAPYGGFFLGYRLPQMKKA